MRADHALEGQAFQRLDEQAWRAVFRRLLPDLLGYARKRTRASESDVEDIVASVFLEAIRGIHSYDPTKGPPSSWVFGIARIQVSRWIREQMRRPPVLPLKTQPEQPPENDMPVILELAMVQFPSEDQAILRSRYFDNIRGRALAERFGLSNRQMAARLRSLRQRLRRRMQQLVGADHLVD